MCGDPEQEYSRIAGRGDHYRALPHRWLFVIARTSSFTYKGQAVDVKLPRCRPHPINGFRL
jgi:adenylate cyclase